MQPKFIPGRSATNVNNTVRQKRGFVMCLKSITFGAFNLLLFLLRNFSNILLHVKFSVSVFSCFVIHALFKRKERFSHLLFRWYHCLYFYWIFSDLLFPINLFYCSENLQLSWYFFCNTHQRAIQSTFHYRYFCWICSPSYFGKPAYPVFFHTKNNTIKTAFFQTQARSFG